MRRFLSCRSRLRVSVGLSPNFPRSIPKVDALGDPVVHGLLEPTVDSIVPLCASPVNLRSQSREHWRLPVVLGYYQRRRVTVNAIVIV